MVAYLLVHLTNVENNGGYNLQLDRMIKKAIRPLKLAFPLEFAYKTTIIKLDSYGSKTDHVFLFGTQNRSACMVPRHICQEVLSRHTTPISVGD